MLKINLLELRTRKKLTYRDLEKLSGVSHSQIVKIESGYAKNPGIITLFKIATALEVRLEELVEYYP